MKAIANRSYLDSLTFVGLVGGLGLLVAGFLTESFGLAIPALAVVLPSLIWGMR